jgi:DNA-directed RNA polymerase subunit RPC12/RpoP
MSDMNDFVKLLTEEQKQKLLEALASGKQQEDQQNASNVGEDFRVYKTDSKLTSRRKEPVKARNNEWQDTGESRDIETNYGEKTPRRKEAPKKASIECHVCGKEFKVDQRYVFGEYYRCNKCGGKK